MKKNKDQIALVRSANPGKIIIGPNESVDIDGYTDKEIDYGETYAMVHECEDSILPNHIDLTPTVFNYKPGKCQPVKINISNLSKDTVVISSKSILCELQPVVLEQQDFNNVLPNIENEILKQTHIDTHQTLTAEETLQIHQLLEKHIDIFSTGDTDIGNCERIKHRIDLLPYCEAPFKQPHRRLPPQMVEEVRKHLNDLLDAGIIEKSCSPWASNIVLVRKKNGKLRMCVDYRMLNQRTIKDAYALPRIEEVFDVLHGAKYFTTVDMKAGYHQVKVEDSHRERTAFTAGPLGFYQFLKMPFGLSNSPATYQRLMEEVLGDYNMTICVIYLDDLIIFSNTFEEHLLRMERSLHA